MGARKRVLLTVNPLLVTGKRYMTQRSLVTALDRHADLLVATAGGYDFRKGLVRAYRRIRGGRFEDGGMVRPAAHLWIVYSDGYYLDRRALGFARRRDFFDAQIDFHQRQLDAGNIGRMVNEPAVESRTLKSWFVGLPTEEFCVIPTYLLASIDEVYECRRNEGALVAKRIWGGGGAGVRRLSSDNDVRCFQEELAKWGDDEIGDYCFQPYCPGDEKRLWFVGGRFVAGRYSHGRATPWSRSTADYDVRPYGVNSEGFAADLEAAQRLCALSGLNVGAIDLIGERINEINGCGTIFTEYKGWQCVVDARPALVRYLVDLLHGL